ncbi:MAG: DUF5372 family protein [Actinomycetota bacterium]
MTHPFHPMAGREFDLVVRKHTWAEDRVFIFDDNGQLRSLPAGWTDVVPADPFLVVASGRSPFRIEDLILLATLVEHLRTECRKKNVK